MLGGFVGGPGDALVFVGEDLELGVEVEHFEEVADLVVDVGEAEGAAPVVAEFGDLEEGGDADGGEHFGPGEIEDEGCVIDFGDEADCLGSEVVGNGVIDPTRGLEDEDAIVGASEVMGEAVHC